jgi:hypothetical protein
MRRSRVLGAVCATAALSVVACSSDDGGQAEPAADEPTATTVPVLAPIEVPDVTIVDEQPVVEVPPRDPELGTLEGSPLDDLPDGVRQLVDFGQRPD